MLNGDTRLIAHLGYPTTTFKSPMIYNPWFDKRGINAAVVPLGVRSEDFARAFPEICRFTNFHGALITMPHKVSVIAFLDDVSTAVNVAGSCNAVRRDHEGRLVGDMFDGEGFVRGILRKGRALAGTRVLVVGSGGVGSAIVASLAKAGVAELALFDAHVPTMNSLADRLRAYYPALKIEVGSRDPAGFDVVVNATPLGMKEDDPLPMDVDRIAPSTFVGEVVMKQEITPFLAAAKSRGCQIQIGTDMLFEQIPAYLEFFGFRSTTPEELRTVAQISY